MSLSLLLFSCVPSWTQGVQYQSWVTVSSGVAPGGDRYPRCQSPYHNVCTNRRRWWSRAWLSPERRLEFGLYDQLMIELRREDQRSFVCRTRISTWMKAFWFDVLIICALSVMWPVRARFAYGQSPFYPLFVRKMFVLSGVRPLLVRFKHYSFVACPVHVRLSYGHCAFYAFNTSIVGASESSSFEFFDRTTTDIIQLSFLLSVHRPLVLSGDVWASLFRV